MKEEMMNLHFIHIYIMIVKDMLFMKLLMVNIK